MTRLTALGQIEDNMKVATSAAYRASTVAHENYQRGQAAAYNDAHKIMKKELQRLRNMLQNGCLTQADFGDDLPY